MNRHERRKARAVGTPARAASAAEYAAGAEKHHAIFRHLLTRLPPEDPPRFALLRKEIGLCASIDDPAIRHKLPRNHSAEIVILALLTFAEHEGIEPPTYMMLRVFIETAGLETDTIEVGEIDKLVGMPSRGGKA